MSTTAIEWKPVDANNQELKDALHAALKSSLSSIVTKAPDGKTNRFVLQTEGYHDIYLYVVEGMKLSASKDDFEETYPKSVFAAVDAIDREAYNLLRDSTTTISANTNAFNKNGLGRLITSANGTIAYADQCIGLLKEKTDMSLFKNLDILLDKKYATQPKDDTFFEAVELSRNVVRRLSKDAKEKIADAKAMVTLLNGFLNLTMIDMNRVKSIQQDWLVGPLDKAGNRRLKPDGTKQDRYCKVMDAEVDRLQSEILNLQTKRDEENDKWATANDKAITLSFAGVFIGWCLIGTAIENAKAKKAKEEYNRLVDMIAKDQGDRATMVSVLELVRALAMHLVNMVPKMQKAVKAMVQLSELFEEQAVNFDIVDKKLGNMETGIESEYFVPRKLWILSGINEAVEKFREIKALAQEFRQGARPQIVNLMI